MVTRNRERRCAGRPAGTSNLWNIDHRRRAAGRVARGRRNSNARRARCSHRRSRHNPCRRQRRPNLGCPRFRWCHSSHHDLRRRPLPRFLPRPRRRSLPRNHLCPLPPSHRCLRRRHVRRRRSCKRSRRPAGLQQRGGRKTWAEMAAWEEPQKLPHHPSRPVAHDNPALKRRGGADLRAAGVRAETRACHRRSAARPVDGDAGRNQRRQAAAARQRGARRALTCVWHQTGSRPGWVHAGFLWPASHRPASERPRRVIRGVGLPRVRWARTAIASRAGVYTNERGAGRCAGGRAVAADAALEGQLTEPVPAENGGDVVASDSQHTSGACHAATAATSVAGDPTPSGGT